MPLESDMAIHVQVPHTGHNLLRLFICGAHSTGKTTLLRELSKITTLFPINEVAREVMETLGISRDAMDPRKHPDVFEHLQREILRKQCQVEQDQRACSQGF